ncbi:ATPase, T2SS/T4P/T4SS family, partial [Klebsiella pneumoniae]|uniref:ATPase, T2SS/T4P/T4SS family n=1 Tax=Klebsiella pneumoniae TaxID=573 RepID=UPI001400CA57
AVVGAAESEVDLDRLMDDIPEVTDLLDTQDGAPVIRMINALLTQAARDEASDIHIEPRREQGTVRFRIDGVLHNVYQFPPQVTMAVVSRLKSLGRMNVAEKRKPQDGRVKTKT